MTVKTGQTISGSFATLAATGALTAATGTPAGTLYVAGVANGASVTVTGSNPYSWSVTLPTLTAGQIVQMYVTATISAIATGGFVFEDVADTSLASDLATTLGVAGAGLTALGDTRLANLDATVSSRSTYAGGAVASVTGSVGSVVGLTAANLDTTISSRAPASTALSNGILPDSVPADGTRPTHDQAMYALYCWALERSVSGTTVTINKVDGSTALMTLTINDASAPTSITRTT